MQAHNLPEHRALYVMVPKTGTRSIVAALGLPKHPPYVSDCRRHNWPGYFRFAFVRNPWDRLVSVWVEKIDAIFSPFRIYGWTPALPFRDFVRAVCAMPPDERDHHFAPQAPLLRYAGEWCVDFLGRFERLNEDWRLLSQAAGWKAPLPHINRSEHKPWREYYTPELAQLVRETFAEDANLFGYRYG